MFAEVPWESTVSHLGEHCQSSQIQKTLSERKDFHVQKDDMPEADISFKVVARGES